VQGQDITLCLCNQPAYLWVDLEDELHDALLPSMSAARGAGAATAQAYVAFSCITFPALSITCRAVWNIMSGSSKGGAGGSAGTRVLLCGGYGLVGGAPSTQVQGALRRCSGCVTVPAACLGCCMDTPWCCNISATTPGWRAAGTWVLVCWMLP
jgi:hypothetical protein